MKINNGRDSIEKKLMKRDIRKACALPIKKHSRHHDSTNGEGKAGCWLIFIALCAFSYYYVEQCWYCTPFGTKIISK